MRSTAALLGLLAWATAAAAEPPPRLVSAANGYSIDLLEEPAGDLGVYQTITMLLAPTEGRSPNVNVRLGRFSGDIVELAATNRVEIEQMGWKILAETRPSPTAVAFEFAGPFSDLPHHWYCRVELEAGRTYVITATAIESQWASVGARLKACVDSFRRELPKKATGGFLEAPDPVR